VERTLEEIESGVKVLNLDKDTKPHKTPAVISNDGDKNVFLIRARGVFFIPTVFPQLSHSLEDLI
jgi:hypothetical protein